MKVLMISGDEQVLNASSGTAKRMIEYGQTFGDLDILLLLSHKKHDTELSSETRAFVAAGKFLRFFHGYRRAKELMKKKKYDAITAQDTERSLVAWLLSRKFHVPWQMQIHTDILSPHFARHSIFDWFRVKLVKFLIPRASGIRVVSERIKKSIIATRLLHPEITVLPIFLDVMKVRNIPVKIDVHERYGRDKFVVLMPTRLTKEKNIEMALKALMGLLDSNSPPQPPSLTLREGGDEEILSPRGGRVNPFLLIIGDGPEKDNLKRIAYGSGLTAENVVFEDAVDFETLISYYKTADVYLLTSVYEGGARAPREALAAGLPVVMTDVAPAHEDIVHGENGLVIPVGDSAVLARSLERLITDHDFYMHLKKAAEMSFPNPETKEEYLSRYKNLLYFER